MTLNDNTERLGLNRPPLFVPSVVRSSREGSAGSVFLDFSDSSQELDSTLGETGSFKYGAGNMGIVSTQQLNIDWSKFENHTFFNSAQVKTNVAFDKIVNEFPFDGTKKELEAFFNKLTGFEKYVYGLFLKNKGYLFFSGSSPSAGSDDGTVVIVKDLAGAQFPTLSRLRTGQTVLDPGLDPMSIEMHLYVPSQSFGNLKQTILSKQSGSNNGFAIVLEASVMGSSQADISMLVVSGAYEDKITLTVNQNQWNHLHWTWDRTPGVHTIFGYKNGTIQNSSSMPIEFGILNTVGNDLYFGSGSTLGSFTQNSTLSGSIDEFRLWHNIRTKKQRNEFSIKPVYVDEDLRLYFKFNEPSGSNTNLVLDYSKNSLHGRINNRGLVLGVREIATGSTSGPSPMANESLELSPALFPSIDANVIIRDTLLLSASLFDTGNPNLITNLVPRHYLIEGQHLDSLQTEEGDILDTLTGTEPRNAKLGSTQVLLSLLYTWAKFFDEMKLYIQAFSTLNRVNYEDIDTIPNDFLSVFAKIEGINLPPLFTGTTIQQYIEGENLRSDFSINVMSLQAIQNQLWKRILINLQEILKSKGTIHSIKSFIRSVGIDPDSNFRIREYGGPTKKPLSFNRENRFEVASMLNFISGGLLVSPPLSASRVEPGIPTTGSSAVNNALLTSGSFTYEGIYKFVLIEDFPTSQSLARFELSGSDGSRKILMNLVAQVGDVDIEPKVTLVAAPDFPAADTLNLSITGADIFDGKQWYVSFGRRRNDDLGLNSNVSSSYFLRLAQQSSGRVLESYVTSAYFMDTPLTSRWQITSGSTFNTRLVVGSSSIAFSPTEHLTGPFGQTQAFRGKVAQMRFWSKYLTDQEWPEHVVNYRSVGVMDPRKNFNFVSASVSGSFERLRIDASTDQIITASDNSGGIQITDFTQNNFVLSGTNFPVNDKVIVPEQFYFSYISPKIDEGVTENKVRIRSFINPENIQGAPWSGVAPVHFINPFETPTDSTKLSIDFSIIDTLDQDIITIFASLDELNNILGNPELLFAGDYKELGVLRDVYFNKLQNKINIKGFFEFYKWFDANIGTFVEQLVPRKTRFLGTNFIIESHILERAKVQYQFEDIYLGTDIRSGLRDTILLQLIEGRISK